MTPLRVHLRSVERQCIAEALRECGSRNEAAKQLGLSIGALTVKMGRLGMSRRRSVEPEAAVPLPRAEYRVRVRRWNGSWTVGTVPLEAMPVYQVESLLRRGDAQLIMIQVTN